ncbi:Thioredoxin-like protein AAED1 [Cytospora mali]|uniref:Thioredoxin-like protein AAED1 n=1 Tax=Cytospora mali TaxID=578113 RepID=A0A194WCG6_CYTMA|nr:Thioredoxin-like protein AAED1 [Valsa mali]
MVASSISAIEDAAGHQDNAGPPLPPRSAGAEKKKEVGSSPRPSIQTDLGDEDLDVNPADFQGEVLTNDELPSPETIRRIENYIVLDRHGKTHTFKSLYTGRNVARRVLVIFVRHFFCGNCQEYLRTLAASITPESLLQLPIPTFIAVVGCGDPALIDMYAAETGSPFPIYADPTRRLYEELGMVKTLALGSRPAYMRKSLVRSSIDSIFQGVKHIKSGLAIRGGDQRQIGGEFLFEPVNLLSPDLPSPVAQEFDARVGVGVVGESNAGAAARHSRTTSVSDNDNDEVEEPSLVEEKKVTWCHRMRTTRDHAEIPELMEVLGLSGQGKPIKDQKRWSKAVDMRKGTGLSLAAQMSRMNQHVVPEGE